MKRGLAALLLLCAVTTSAGAAAQPQMNVYFAANAMDEETAGALMERTRQAFPQAQWRAIGPTEERDLRALILGDDMPDLIVCAPSEASLWVSDGLFIALDKIPFGPSISIAVFLSILFGSEFVAWYTGLIL